MSKRVRNRIYILGLISVIYVIIIAVAYWDIAHLKGYQSASEEHSTYRAERDAQHHYYEECLKTQSIGIARECINSAPYTSRDYQRAEEDLDAQRQMAQWAERMLWATWLLGILTASVAAVGTYLLYATLRETREIGQAQVRAYLSIRNGSYSISGNDIRFAVQVANSGQSTSRRCNMSCKIRGSAVVGDTYFTYSAKCDERAVPDLPSGGPFNTDEFIIKDTDIVVSNGPVDNILDAIRENPGVLFFDIQLDWIDVFKRQHTIVANLVIAPIDYSLNGIGEYPTFRKLEVKGMEEGV